MKLFKQKNVLSAYSDNELLYKYGKSGELIYFGELYNRYSHLVFLVCVKYLKDRDRSKDAVMDIFEMLIKKLLSQQIENFKAWLYSVTKNHCLMELRKNKFDYNFEEISESAENYFMENDSILHLLEKNDISEELIHKKIDLLKEEQKNCIREFYFNKKSYKEISLNNGFDEKKVKSCIQNGKRNLKILLENHVKTAGEF